MARTENVAELQNLHRISELTYKVSTDQMQYATMLVIRNSRCSAIELFAK
jgi:hypothetical protein